MWRRIIYHPEVNYALRQTLVLCLPVSLGWLFGDLQKGLLFSHWCLPAAILPVWIHPTNASLNA
ncbi:hypothetical protein CKS_1619 [Pantoea stewartii subsp. stewartii DC283]|uniref:Uncharacterized protein n=1 Tax=Pantoea stewartii subsp. stewartii DC283 TaxID=660596 RepID=H3RGB0_PANSE|nr:hypothetical protein CKS_1619 [Pantoea stewartii subsp. stewartii DC283]